MNYESETIVGMIQVEITGDGGAKINISLLLNSLTSPSSGDGLEILLTLAATT
jgi:hypothetical protein